MECLRYVVCTSCYKQLGTDEDVLMCGGCKLWQHKKCSRGVDPSFYSKFYLAVAQEQKPVHWQCHYCTKHHDSWVSLDDQPQDKGQKKKSSLQILPHPPLREVHVYGSSLNTDELDVSFDINRRDREGPALPSLISTTTSRRNDNKENQSVQHNQWKKPQGITSGSQGVNMQKKPQGITSGSQGINMQKKPQGITSGSQGINMQKKPQGITSGSQGINMQKKPQGITSGSQGINDAPKQTATKVTPFVRGAIVYTPPPHILRLYLESKNKEAETESSDSDSDTMEPLAKRVRRRLSTPMVNKSAADFSFSSDDSSDISIDELNTATICEPAVADKQDTDKALKPSLPAPKPSLPAPKPIRAPKPSLPAPKPSLPAPKPSLPAPKPSLPAPKPRLPSDNSSDSTAADITYSVTRGTAESKLTDSLGYTYQIKFNLGARVIWACTEKIGRCSATIIQQRKTKFSRGAASHNHQSSKSQTSTTTDSVSDTVTSQSDTRHEDIAECQQVVKETTAALHPSKQAQTVKPTAPVQMTSVPVQMTTVPVQKTTAPVQKTTAPVQKCIAPVQKTTAPVQKCTAPVQKTTAPVQKCTAPVQKTTPQSNPEDNSPPTVSSKPAQPTSATQPATYQEVTTCAWYSFKPQSALIDEDGFIYKTKIEDLNNSKTVWKCTHKEQQGSCKGKVTFNYVKEFNDRIGVDDFVWLSDHTCEGDRTITLVQPHNHEADRTVSVLFKLKAMIHRQIYGWGHHNWDAAKIIKLASETMHEHEREYEPSGAQQLKNLKNFVRRQQRVYRDEPRSFLDRYMLER